MRSSTRSWPAGAPRDPKPALQTHLSRLRKRLPGIISSTDAGYRLDAAAVSLDAEVLAAAVAAAAADPQAADTIAATLARWRGPAYPELADDDDGRAEATRLEELRILATERHAEARLIAGATDGLVVDLAALVDEHPLRERPRALLMEALAAEGRTADALRVFDDFRRVLGDELGIEPSGGLTAQHAALLEGSSVAAWTPPHRLPVAATSLLGRDDLVGDAISLVGDHRVVTLIGPGGVGKSRLAIEVGHRLRDERPSRPVVLIELATATTDSAVEAVAAALAIDGRPGVGLNDRLPAVLGDLEVVLLLDNCEHVLEPMAALVEAVVAGCPNVTMVTTSRERLRVNGEVLCPVPPLGTAAEDDPAVLLFVERAAAVSPGFAPRREGSGPHHRDRASPRRVAPRHRAGRRPAAHAGRGGGRRRARPPVPAPLLRLADLEPARIVGRRGGLVRRSARRRAAAHVRRALGLCGLVHGR